MDYNLHYLNHHPSFQLTLPLCYHVGEQVNLKALTRAVHGEAAEELMDDDVYVMQVSVAIEDRSRANTGKYLSPTDCLCRVVDRNDQPTPMRYYVDQKTGIMTFMSNVPCDGVELTSKHQMVIYPIFARRYPLTFKQRLVRRLKKWRILNSYYGTGNHA